MTIGAIIWLIIVFVGHIWGFAFTIKAAMKETKV